MDRDNAQWIRQLNLQFLRSHDRRNGIWAVSHSLALHGNPPLLMSGALSSVITAAEEAPDVGLDLFDQGAIQIGSDTIRWQIIYLNHTLREPSTDPANPYITTRVLLMVLDDDLKQLR